MLLLGGSDFLQAVVPDLCLVKAFGVSRELVQGIDCAVSLLCNLLPGSLECLWHLVDVVGIGIGENLIVWDQVDGCWFFWDDGTWLMCMSTVDNLMEITSDFFLSPSHRKPCT